MLSDKHTYIHVRTCTYTHTHTYRREAGTCLMIKYLITHAQGWTEGAQIYCVYETWNMEITIRVGISAYVCSEYEWYSKQLIRC